MTPADVLLQALADSQSIAASLRQQLAAVIAERDALRNQGTDPAPEAPEAEPAS